MGYSVLRQVGGFKPLRRSGFLRKFKQCTNQNRIFLSGTHRNSQAVMAQRHLATIAHDDFAFDQILHSGSGIIELYQQEIGI